MRLFFVRIVTTAALGLLLACGGGGGGTPAAVAPSITAQPQSATAVQGRSATFSVTASGTAPLTYQWRKGGAAVSGGTASALTFTSALPTDAGSYDVVVSNSAGSVTSGIATLTVIVPPALSVPPVAQTVLAPAPATFSVTATGTAPLAYQWQRNGVDIPGATFAVHTTGATAATDDGAVYRVTVTNAGGSATSPGVALTVNSGAALTLQPTAQAVVAPAPATFTAAASGSAPLSWQWRRNGVAVTGATSPTYTTGATSAADQGAVYSVQVGNAFGSDTSAGATLTVNLPPTVTTQPTAQAVVAPAGATFSVAATGTAPLSYQWQRGGVNIAGATGTSYTLSPTALADHGASFAVVVTNPYGTRTSNAAILTVTAAPVAPSITTAPAPQTVLAPATATFSVTAAGTAPLAYQWKRNGADIGGAIASSYTTAATSLADHGAQYSVVVTNSVGTATGGPALLTVNAAPAITVHPSGQTVTAPATATFNVTATGTAPLTYQWKRNGTDISGATASTYTTPATVAGDSGSLYSVVVTNAFGTQTSAAATLTVNVPPTITVPPASQTVLAPATASFAVTATGTTPFTYQWKRGGVNISGATGSTYTTPATTIADHGAQFSVAVSNAAGSATSAAATLSVNAGPVITAAPTSRTVVVGSTATFSVTATGTATLGYQWRKNGLDIGGATLSSYTTPATVMGDSGSVYTVSITNAYGSVVSGGATLTVSATPLLDLAIPTVYLSQATQTPTMTVPLVKDRDGYLRVFVVANLANTATPRVRVRIYNSADVLQNTWTITAPGASVPLAVNEASLTSSWNLAIPGTWIQTGNKLLVDVDDDAAVAETDETNNAWPSSGAAQSLDVRTLNPFRLTAWAVQTGDGRVGGVNAGTLTTLTSFLDKVWPINTASDRLYGGIFVTSVTTLASDGSNWGTTLNELRLKRSADGVTNRYYYGVVNPNYGGGVAGLGYIGLPTAIGWDKAGGYGESGLASGVFAHEVGHNFGLNHAPCGGPASPDPAYPYAGGLIGMYGNDAFSGTGTLKSPSTYTDILSYCSTVWVSDYNYKKVLASRQAGTVPVADPGTGEPSLLLWGRLERGTAVLEPAFQLTVPPQVPEPGDHLLEGLDAAGARVFAVSFTPEAVGCDPEAGQHFAFALPLPAADTARVAQLRWTKAGETLAARGGAELPMRAEPTWEPILQALPDGATRVLWDAAAHPLLMVRDRATGSVLAFGRGGEVRLPATAEELELHRSDGVHSRESVHRRPRLED